MSDAWLHDSAANLGRGIEAGRIDPVDLTEIHLAAIDNHEQSRRIYARTTIVRARAEAAAASTRARGGLRRSPLDGVPISWKDLFDTAGVETEAGSALLQGRVPSRDAAVLQNATAAGLVCLGKTHMSELAFSGLGLNPVTATAPNRHDPDRLAGGSSSGAAASVALGLAAAGIGSDTGGSVRVPSAWNDLVGYKTGHGLLSLEGVVPLCPSFDTVGPLCRSVEDAGLLVAAMGGGPAPDLRGATVKGARFLVLEGDPLERSEAAVRAAFESAVDRLASAGARIERRALACVDEAQALAGVLFAPEGYGIWHDAIEAEPEKMFPRILERFHSGKDVPAWKFVAGWKTLNALRAAYRAETAGFDAVLLPACPILPPKADPLTDDADAFNTANLLTLHNTRIANLMGLAALTLPTDVPSAGLMLQGPGEDGARLLRLGAAVERGLA